MDADADPGKNCCKQNRREVRMIHRDNHHLLFSAVVFLYICTLFVNIPGVREILAVLVLFLFFISVRYASGLFRILATVFSGTGIILIWRYNLPVWESIMYVNDNLALLSLLFMLPWMSGAVRSGRYDRRINTMLASDVSRLGQLYPRALGVSYILTAFINLSALSLSQGVLKENLKALETKVQQSFIAKTTLRGFAAALCWSPMEILVAISVDATGVSYFTMLPWLMLVSFLTLSLDGIIGRNRWKNTPYISDAPAASPKRLLPDLLQLAAALTVFLMCIVAIGNFFQLNFILTVTLVIFPFAFLWAVVIRRTRSFFKLSVPLWKTRASHMQNFVLLFVSLAFFSSVLNETPLLEVIQAPFLAVEDTPWIALFMIQGAYLLLSMTGIHPIAVIAVLVEAVTPLFAEANPLSFAIVLVTGALATATVGTYGVTVTLTAANTLQNPYRITWRNMPFAVMYGLIGTLTAVFLL
jgi:hypothetical protein